MVPALVPTTSVDGYELWMKERGPWGSDDVPTGWSPVVQRIIGCAKETTMAEGTTRDGVSSLGQVDGTAAGPPASATGATATGATATGAASVGFTALIAAAVGAVAIGALAIGALRIGRLRVRHLRVLERD
jgi:hypothetical protein